MPEPTGMSVMVALRAESMLARGGGGGNVGWLGHRPEASVYHPEIGGYLTGPDKSALPTYSGTLGPRLLPCSRRTRASAKVPSTATRSATQVPTRSLQAHRLGRKPWEDGARLCGPEPPPSAQDSVGHVACTQ